MKPDIVDLRYRSGAYPIERGLSKGYQEYKTDETKWPVNKPMPKVEALTQCSGMLIILLFFNNDSRNGFRSFRITLTLLIDNYILFQLGRLSKFFMNLILYEKFFISLSVGIAGTHFPF